MRALTLLVVLLAAACATQERELFPEDLSFASDAAPDFGGRDLLAPDLASACVCRLLACRANADCQSVVGPGSTCDSTLACTGATQPCTLATDCPGGFTCTQGPTSTAACL